MFPLILINNTPRFDNITNCTKVDMEKKFLKKIFSALVGGEGGGGGDWGGGGCHDFNNLESTLYKADACKYM